MGYYCAGAIKRGLNPIAEIIFICICFCVALFLCFLSVQLGYADGRSVVFTDVTQDSGIKFKHYNGRSQRRHIVETMGAGAAFLDYDNDGFLDLYIINGGSLEDKKSRVAYGNMLYRNNNGSGTFSDVTEKARVGDSHYGMGVAVGDYNNDGFVDIYVTNYGPNVLYQNQGDGSFADVTQKAKVGNSDWGTGCAFLDFDLDGDLDLYVVNYVEYRTSMKPCINLKTGVIEYCHPRTFRPAKDVLYQNNGDGTFTDVTRESGVYNTIPCRGLGIGIGDCDNNGYPDIYIANDTDRNCFYLNNEGVFEDIAFSSGTAFNKDGIPEGGMGVDIADYNKDGWLDIFVTNTETNTLYKSHGDGTFTDISDEASLGGVSASLVGFGTKFFDYDNDGELDIFVANGEVQEFIDPTTRKSTYPQRDQLYRSNGDGTYTEVSASSGKYFSKKYVGRGAAFGDYDNDGDIDLLVFNCNQSVTLLRNDGGNANNWLAVKLVGVQSNRDGIGARIRVTAEGEVRIAEVQSAASYLSANDLRVIFGLGRKKVVDEIEVLWPGGNKQTLTNIKANQLIEITEKM